MSHLDVVPGCADIEHPHQGATSAGRLLVTFVYFDLPGLLQECLHFLLVLRIHIFRPFDPNFFKIHRFLFQMCLLQYSRNFSKD